MRHLTPSERAALLAAYRQAFAAKNLPIPSDAELAVLVEREVSLHELADLLNRGGTP